MKEKALVILAAGMGSRFGGMKQVEPVGPNGEFIIDYSIYSAIKYGFNKVVFIIKEENYEIFKNTIGKRISNVVKVEYAFQKLDDIPAGFEVPDGRVKPWGTAHALYSARNYINGNFGLVTSDDYYGDEAFKELSEYLDTHNNNVIIGYEIGKTLSENGSVKRAVIFHVDGIIEDIIESSCKLDTDGTVECTPLDPNKEMFYVHKDQPVSMLLNGFRKEFIDEIADMMASDFEKNKDNLLDYEMLIPDVLSKEINNGQQVNVISTNSKWMGMTYRSDCEKLKEYINKEIEKGVYPIKLW